MSLRNTIKANHNVDMDCNIALPRQNLNYDSMRHKAIRLYETQENVTTKKTPTTTNKKHTTVTLVSDLIKTVDVIHK